MKRIYLSLLPCLASLLASAQEPLNGDSLASDFRYLVKELAATHPDPYSGFGGKVFFYEQAFHLENELRRTPGTKQTFFDKVSIFLSNLQDGHTYLLPPTANIHTINKNLIFYFLYSKSTTLPHTFLNSPPLTGSNAPPP